MMQSDGDERPCARWPVRQVEYAPDGELLVHLDTPVSRPTCPGFAGPGLRQLVLTTAWEGLTADQREREPWAGHLLVAPAPAAGRPPHRFAGSRR